MRSNLAPAQELQVLHGLIMGKLPNLTVSSHKALVYQILHVAYLVSLYKECPNHSPLVKFGPTPGATSFTWTYKGKIFRNLPVPSHKA